MKSNEKTKKDKTMRIGRFPFFLALFSFLLFSSCNRLSNSSSASSSSASGSSSPTMSSYSSSITGSAVFSLGSSSEYLSSETSAVPLHVYSIEMSGQYGDSMLIDYGNYEILVDGGSSLDSYYVADALDEYVTDHVLDLLVVTHAHADHYGGLPRGLSDSGITGITQIVDYGYGSSNTYVTARKSYVAKGTEYHPITELIMHTDGIYHVSSRLSLQFLNTNCYLEPGSSATDPNTTSICFILRFDNVVFYLNGDSTGTTDAGVRANYPNLIGATDVVVSKAAHHGSDSNGSNGSTFLRLFLRPDYVFISAAIDQENQTSDGVILAQHPFYAPLQRFLAYTSQVYWNGINGKIDMACDGTGVTFSGGGRTHPYYVGGILVDAASEANVTIYESQWYKTYLAA